MREAEDPEVRRVVGRDRGCMAWLRVYEPLAAFSGEERAHYAAQAAGRRRSLWLSDAAEQAWVRRAAVQTPPDLAPGGDADRALVLDVDGVTHVSPVALRMRCLLAAEEWAGELPAEIAAAFVPPAVLEKAAGDLEALRTRRPDASVHAQVSSWVVPLRWFVCFEPAERLVLTEDAGTTLLYRTGMARARRRVARAYAVLRRSMPEDSDGPVTEIGGLGRWLEEFHPRSWVELDYGGVGDLLGAEAVAEEDSVSDIAAALGALHEGDGQAAGGAYARVAGRWQDRAGRATAS